VVRVPTLVELCSELLPLAYTLRGNQDLGDPAEVRRGILRALDHLEEEGRKQGYSSHHTEGARFALVALLDEAILSSQWSGRDAWRSNTLQREIFRINVAGEEFYTRLEKLRQNVQENRPLLEVFYACLVMGFEGRYKLLGRERLEALIHSLASEIAPGQAWKMDNLSPAWRRPDDFPETMGEGIPVWVTVLGIVGVILVLILIFRGVALQESGRVAQTIHGYLQNTGR